MTARQRLPNRRACESFEIFHSGVNFYCGAYAQRRFAMNALARVADARAVRIEDEIARRGIKLRGGVDRCGPCPRCGGTDRFSINIKKQVFNCRGFEGGDVIALVRHIDGVSFAEAITYLAGVAPQRTV